MNALATLDELDEQVEIKNCEELELADDRDRLTASFKAFVVAAWPIVEPTQPLVDNWHVDLLCSHLEGIEIHDWKRVYRRSLGSGRHIINIPPGTLKSLLVSVLFPAWVWARRQGRGRFIVASYGSALSVRDNLRVRDLVTSDWYSRRFQFELKEDQNNKTRYNTTSGGWRIATSVDGVGTGEHPDYFIVDDPLTAEQAESTNERDRANRWLDRTVSTRGMTRGVTFILIMQRLHEEDCTGHLLKQGDVEHVCLPMRYLPTRAKTADDPGYEADPRDPRTEPGELLIPQLLDEEKVSKLERILGPYATAGQLQQQPAPEGGGLFKREWFKDKILKVAPKKLRRCVRGWDTASTPKGGDYTVGVKIGETYDDVFVVLDVVRDQLSPAGVDALMLATAQRDGDEVAQREEKEGGSSGKAVVEARAKLLKGFDYSFVQIDKSKITRAKPFRSQCEAGNVYLVDGPWVEEYLRELCVFPTGKHDDQVDGSSTSFNAVLLEPRKKKLSASWA